MSPEGPLGDGGLPTSQKGFGPQEEASNRGVVPQLDTMDASRSGSYNYPFARKDILVFLNQFE